jgi:hypothetical protein
MSRAPKLVRYVPPAIDPQRVAHLADRVLAQDVVTPNSIEEFSALLTELRQRGYTLKQRTEWEQRAAPWLLLVVPLASVSVETIGA